MSSGVLPVGHAHVVTARPWVVDKKLSDDGVWMTFGGPLSAVLYAAHQCGVPARRDPHDRGRIAVLARHGDDVTAQLRLNGRTVVPAEAIQ